MGGTRGLLHLFAVEGQGASRARGTHRWAGLPGRGPGRLRIMARNARAPSRVRGASGTCLSGCPARCRRRRVRSPRSIAWIPTRIGLVFEDPLRQRHQHAASVVIVALPRTTSPSSGQLGRSRASTQWPKGPGTGRLTARQIDQVRCTVRLPGCPARQEHPTAENDLQRIQIMACVAPPVPQSSAAIAAERGRGPRSRWLLGHARVNVSPTRYRRA
jgi:hypothetical protein